MEDNMNKETIQQTVKAQFGRSAADYVTSAIHAKGWTLQRMVDFLRGRWGADAVDAALA